MSVTEEQKQKDIELSQELNGLLNSQEVQNHIKELRLVVDNLIEAFEHVGVDKLIAAIFDNLNPGEKDLLPDGTYSEMVTSNELSFIHSIYVRVMMGVYADILPEQAITIYPIELTRAIQEVFTSYFGESIDDKRLLEQLNANREALTAIHFDSVDH